MYTNVHKSLVEYRVSYGVSSGFDGHKLALASMDVFPREDNWKTRCRPTHVDRQL